MSGEAVVPEHKEGDEVPAGETGYAVGSGELRVGDDFFELDLSQREMSATIEAIRWHDETPTVLKECFRGFTFHGDLPALRQTVDALKAFEQRGTMGGAKTAYDARTAFNHAEYTVRDRLQGDDDE